MATLKKIYKKWGFMLIVSDLFDFESTCVLCDSDDVNFYIVDNKTIKLVCNNCGCVDYIEVEE